MENPVHKKILIPAVVIVALAVAILVFNTQISDALNRLNFTPKLEPYTELYFNNSENLPKSISKGQKITFSFNIHNVEGIQTTYPYTVNFVYKNGQTLSILKGTVTLADDETRTVIVSHTSTLTDEEGMVQVTLKNLNQSIDFLIPNNN
ncbi:MAG TPA: hypothetical protein VL576_01045 [Candidatus Paceibacterota bacterium]|jgi:hypothetical protein|nr:hypothetical protein [Candidatus Paceibacterota bacterium]